MLALTLKDGTEIKITRFQKLYTSEQKIVTTVIDVDSKAGYTVEKLPSLLTEENTQSMVLSSTDGKFDDTTIENLVLWNVDLIYSDVFNGKLSAVFRNKEDV